MPAAPPDFSGMAFPGCGSVLKPLDEDSRKGECTKRGRPEEGTLGSSMGLSEICSPAFPHNGAIVTSIHTHTCSNASSQTALILSETTVRRKKERMKMCVSYYLPDLNIYLPSAR